MNGDSHDRSDGELAALFFSIFSRYEYALKAAGHVHVGPGDAAEADWDHVDEVLRALAPEHFHRLWERAGVLAAQPPRKQVYRNGALDFVETGPPGDAAKSLTIWLRRVRNNLFHGGKYSRDSVMLTGRSRELICCSIYVLDELLTVSTLKDVTDQFEGYGSPER